MPAEKSSMIRFAIIAGIAAAAAVGGVSLSRAALPPATDRAEHHLAPLPHRTVRTVSSAKGDRWEPTSYAERPALSEHELHEARMDEIARWRPPAWGYLAPPRQHSAWQVVGSDTSSRPVGSIRVEGKTQDRFARP
jgi:hypothetical protein